LVPFQLFRLTRSFHRSLIESGSVILKLLPNWERTQLHKRILSPIETRRIKKYLAADGERDSTIRKLVTLYKQRLPQIEEDIALLRQLSEAYERNKTK